MISSSDIPQILTILVIVVIVFLLIRELLTWYWKLNTIVKQQEEQTELLKQIFKQLGGEILDSEDVPEEKLKGMLDAGMISKEEYNRHTQKKSGWKFWT